MKHITASEVMERIYNGEEFDSPYTSLSVWGIMEVNDNAIFRDLSQEDKLKHSDLENGRPVLGIWNDVWVWLEEYDKWIRIATRTSAPDFVYISPNAVMDVSTFRIFVEK